MVTGAPDLRGLTDDEIWEQLHGGAVDSDLHKQCIYTLQLRNLERQTNAAAAQAQAAADTAATSHDLARFTRTLARATWALVAVSVGLVVAALLQVPWILKAIGR